MNNNKILEFNLFGNVYRVTNPSRLNITAEDRQQFSHAGSVLNEYHGLPEQLQAAFEAFIQIQSKPLFYAGIAMFLISYSYKHKSKYDDEGLKYAQKWVAVAQKIAPNELGVILAGLDCYLAQKEYPKSRELLTHGLSLYPDDFEMHKRHIDLLTRQGTIRQIEKAIQTAHKLKLTKVQKVSLYSQESYAYLLKRQWKKATKSGKRLTKLTPTNPWVWHNLSIAQYESKNSFTAYASNRKALSLMEFGAAQDMQKRIVPMLIVQIFAVLAMIMILVYQIL